MRPTGKHTPLRTGPPLLACPPRTGRRCKTHRPANAASRTVAATYAVEYHPASSCMPTATPALAPSARAPPVAKRADARGKANRPPEPYACHAPCPCPCGPTFPQGAGGCSAGPSGRRPEAGLDRWVHGTLVVCDAVAGRAGGGAAEEAHRATNGRTADGRSTADEADEDGIPAGGVG